MNIIKTVDEFTGILAVPAYKKLYEFEGREIFFMAIYVEKEFLDILKFIRKFTETASIENDPVTLGKIEFYPKKETFPVLLFEGKLEYSKFPFNFSGFELKNILDPTRLENGHLQWINSNSISDPIFIVYDLEGKYLRFSCDDCDGVEYDSYDIDLDSLINYIEENLEK